jgi:hypothetical protein
MKDNKAAQLYKKYKADLKQLQETCPHSELSQPMGEMTSDCRNHTGRTVQICLDCNKVVKFKTHCQQCWAKSQGWAPFPKIDYSMVNGKFIMPKEKYTELDETTALIDPQRVYRGYLCKDCLNEVPDRDTDRIWTQEQQDEHL